MLRDFRSPLTPQWLVCDFWFVLSWTQFTVLIYKDAWQAVWDKFTACCVHELDVGQIHICILAEMQDNIKHYCLHKLAPAVARTSFQSNAVSWACVNIQRTRMPRGQPGPPCTARENLMLKCLLMIRSQSGTYFWVDVQRLHD